MADIGSGGNSGTFKQASMFDGIACNDGHLVTKLDHTSSKLAFKTLALEDWRSEVTVEFWFKLAKDDSYRKDGHIFSFYDKTNKQNYF